MRRLNVTLDEHIDAILRRSAKSGAEASFVRIAIIEKAARDEYRSELDELRAENAELRQRLDRIERALNIP